MGRRSQTKPRSNKNNKPTTFKTQPTVIPQQNSTNMMGTIGQGMSLGAGAAIGSAAINGVMDSFSNSNNQPSNYSYCDNVKKSYKACLEKSINEVWMDDDNKCSILIKNFKECFDSHRV